MTEREELAAAIRDAMRGPYPFLAVADWVLERERALRDSLSKPYSEMNYAVALGDAIAQRDALQRRLEEGQVAWLDRGSSGSRYLIGELWSEAAPIAMTSFERVRVVKEG